MEFEDKRSVLAEKYSAEQVSYKKWLLSQPPEEILNHSREYTAREEILSAVKSGAFAEKTAAALLRGNVSLTDVFKDYSNAEMNHADAVRSTLESRGNAILRDEFMQKHTPLYPNTGTYASEHGELEQYRASYQANVACKNAIEAAISDHYREWNLDSKSAVAQVAERFGMDRISYVLAATIQNTDWDRRISTSNKAWAKTIPVSGDRNTRAFVISQAHSGLVDLFANQVRKELAERQVERKPSVLEKLKAAPVKNAPKISAHSKGQER